MCQPRRAFQSCSHIGFSANGQIDVHFPAILHTIENVVLSGSPSLATQGLSANVALLLSDLIAGLEREQSDRLGEELKVLFLSKPDAPETLVLTHKILHSLRDSGMFRSLG